MLSAQPLPPLPSPQHQHPPKRLILKLWCVIHATAFFSHIIRQDKLRGALEECLVQHSDQHQAYLELAVHVRLLITVLEGLNEPTDLSRSYLAWLKTVQTPLENHLKYLDKQDMHLRHLRAKRIQVFSGR